MRNLPLGPGGSQVSENALLNLPPGLLVTLTTTDWRGGRRVSQAFSHVHTWSGCHDR